MNDSRTVLPRWRLGVSACLAGQEVRFDGGHKRSDFVTGVLARHFELVPVCPEVLLGLGVPRPTLRLVRGPLSPRLVEPKSGRDLTVPMQELSARTAEELRALDLTGYVFKKDSPTCGFTRVKVYDGNGIPGRDGVGVFAAAIRAAMPLLPVEDEGRLRDPGLRDAFLTRMFAYRRMRDLFDGPWTLADLQRFHARWKMMLLAWSPAGVRVLGRMVALAEEPSAATAEAYATLFMAAFAAPPSRARHVNVLQHLIGHFRGRADDGERQELNDIIAEFARGELPLQAPLLLVRHHLRRHDVPWLATQTYLEPYPRAILAEAAA